MRSRRPSSTTSGAGISPSRRFRAWRTWPAIVPLALGCATTPVRLDRTVAHEVAPPGCECPVWARLPAGTQPVKSRVEPGWIVVPPEAGK